MQEVSVPSLLLWSIPVIGGCEESHQQTAFRMGSTMKTCNPSHYHPHEVTTDESKASEVQQR